MIVDLIQAPPINRISIDKLSANFINISWDDVGRNFYYLVEIRDVTSGGGWIFVQHTSEPKLTIDTLTKQRKYQIRIAVSSRGFAQSEWFESEIFETFMYNLYTFSMMNEMILSDKFIDEKFVNNNQDYIRFNNDVILASLMKSGFKYNPAIPDISYISDSILKRNEYHEVLGKISKLCRDEKRVMMGYIDEVLYMTERFQKLAYTSNDKGQSWQAVELFDGRLGNPITNTIFSQNSTTTIALGYDHVYYGRPSSNVRWSSIRERFSQTDVSFTRMDDQLKLGYEIEVFNRYAKLPPELEKGQAESFVITDDYVLVAGNGVIRFVDINNAKYDEDPTSPTFNQRLFNEEPIYAFENKGMVMKKMDAIGGKILLLVSGRLKEGKLDKHNPENIEPCNNMGVYEVDIEGRSVKRVFGNTEAERYYIDHFYTNMSTNGREFFINYTNYQDTKFSDYNKTIQTEYGGDREFIISQQHSERGYLNSAKPLMGSWRTTPEDVSVWKRGFMKYYNEADFTYMARSNNRVFITSEKNIGIVHGERFYTKVVDNEGPGSEDRILGETWENSIVTINSPNINFQDFNTYSSGIMIYKESGEIVGFFEFMVDAITEVDLIWKPKEVMLIAELIGQTREVEVVEPPLQRLNDPNLVPFIKKIIPDNYFQDSDIEESRYYKFIKLYLEYLSEARDSNYKSLLNITRNKDPLSVDSFEYLWSEMYKRNIYLDKDKKEEAIRFFLTRKQDFYSSKGTIESYKFLFKLLYNEDVEIDDETDIMNYYVTVRMDNIDQGIIGKTLFTKTGRCIITNIERVYIDGRVRWNLTVTKSIGILHRGQVIQSEDGRYSGVVEHELRGKEYLYNDIDYINSGQAYYVMRIKSKLPVSRYRDDVIRFVHPLGIDFMGIVDITMFMNAGLNMKHVSTEINKYATLRFDSGYPTHYPNRVIKFDNNGEPSRDPYTGKIEYIEHPRNGAQFEIDEDEYNKENDVDLDTIENETIRNYVEEYLPSERRSRFSPTFDTSSITYSNYMNLVDSFIEDSYKYRYKDNIGLPRDPRDPTQEKLGEEIK